jgi:hypothetical protein
MKFGIPDVRTIKSEDGEVFGAVAIDKQHAPAMIAIIERLADAKECEWFRNKYRPGTTLETKEQLSDMFIAVGFKEKCLRAHEKIADEMFKASKGKPMAMALVSLATTLAKFCPICECKDEGPMSLVITEGIEHEGTWNGRPH